MAAGAALVIVTAGAPLRAATLEVGPGKTFRRIEAANAKARPGDVIRVYPLRRGRAYEKVAVYVRQRNLTFRAVPGQKKGGRVKLSGAGFDYRGRGRIPRARFQFNPGTDHCILEGFALSGAHNQRHNGAGVRINQANHVTIRDCEIFGNDMGIMSNGDGTPATAINQRIERCIIHDNGNEKSPGFNHNLYLGGTSVTLSFCEVYASLTGHNVKSRAHYTRVEYSYIHDSANREFDLVDARDTARPESHAVLLGNVIVKDRNCRGNRAVIHFGQDGGGEHDGTLFLIHNTIVTPFISPVADLSAPAAGAHFLGNIISGGAGRKNQVLAAVRHGASLRNVRGSHNWLSGGFAKLAGGLKAKENHVSGKGRGRLPFANPAGHDFRLTEPVRSIVNQGLPHKRIKAPPAPGAAPRKVRAILSWQYRHPGKQEPRPRAGKPDLGAYEYSGR